MKTILLQTSDPYDGTISSRLISMPEAIHIIDMNDCVPPGIENQFFDVSQFGVVKPLTVCDAWHCPKDPLLIELKDESGATVYSGYGTDH